MHGLHSIAEVNPIACSIAMVDVVDVPESSDSAEYSSRRFSLSHQASFEKQQIEGLKRKNTLKRRKILEATLTHDTKVAQKLNDEGIELIFTANSKDPVKFNVLLCNTGFFMQFMKGCLTVFLPAFLKTIELHTIVLNHIESRPSISATDMDVLAECEGAKENVISCFAVISEQFPTVEVSLYKTENQKEVPWFPRHISDLDKCSHCITKYEPTTDPRHPGFGDLEYIARREELNNQAIGFKHGDMIPYIQYTESEHATWRAVFAKLEVLHAELACEKYRRHLKMLLDEGVLSRDRIPQLRDVNKYLESSATQYIRHSGSPHHSPEPDLIHELLGHVPMFADADLAQMSQDIGLMSLGASDEQIEKLATVYWFIVEFGLCREDGKLKAIGAGLLSAYGELQHACSDVPEHRDFLPNETALQKYQDDDYQPLYYVAEGIQEALLKLRQYAKELNRPFNLIYDPYTRSILEIKEMKDIEPVLSRFKLDFSAISNVLQLLPEQQRPFMKQRPVS